MSTGKDEPFTFFLLGPQSSGKTTLVQQLKSMLHYHSLLHPESIDIAPTAGQELETLSLPSCEDLVLLFTEEHNGDGSTATEAGLTRKQIIAESKLARKEIPTQLNQVSAPSPTRIGMGVNPSPKAGRQQDVDDEESADMMSEIARRHSRKLLGVGTRSAQGPEVVSVRELGGKMSPSWGKFISSRMRNERQRPTADDAKGSRCHDQHALIFCVDASLAWQVPVAVTEFLNVLLREDDVLQWSARVLLLFNKRSMPFGLIPTSDLSRWFVDPLRNIGEDGVECESIARRVDVMEVDTWSGLGLMDVLLWMRGQAEM